MSQYILSFDQGTTSSRAIVFDHMGNRVSVAQKEFQQFYPQPGWVEHDPHEIWSTQAGVAAEAVTKMGLNGSSLAAIGITNQRETVIIWHRETGKAIYNAIVWQDRRTAAYCDQLLEAGHEPVIRQKTGLLLDAYFSATKIRWILDHVEGAQELADQGLLAFGTVDSWLVWNLTQGELHITDTTNASRTMLCNIHTGEWDQELLDIFGIPRSMLPEIRTSSEVYGYTKTTIFASKVPIAGIAGDQQAALFGQMCTEKGMVKNTYGTGGFLLMNIGAEPIVSEHNLLTTVACDLGGERDYVLEGSVFIAGAVVQWMRDGLGIIDSAGQVEKLAEEVDSTEGVYFVPAFAGLGAPHWNQQAKGSIVGLTRGSTAAHIARAGVDAIAYQTFDVLQSMEQDTGIQIQEIRVDGGVTVNDRLMQFQSNLTRTQVIRPAIVETTALGAAYLAGLAVGYWKSIDEIREHWQVERVFEPHCSQAEIDRLIRGWQRAVSSVVTFATKDD